MGAVRTPGFLVKLRSFFQDSWTELQKVVWPSRNEAVRLTVMVILLSVAVGLLLGAIDAVLGLTIDGILLGGR